MTRKPADKITPLKIDADPRAVAWALMQKPGSKKPKQA